MTYLKSVPFTSICTVLVGSAVLYRSKSSKLSLLPPSVLHSFVFTFVMKPIRFSLFLGCGGTVNADIPGVITSPNYPRNYPHNTQCIWVLRGTPGKKVTLTFTNFDVEAHGTCAYDYLELRQGDNANASLINRYCGLNLPPSVTSFGNSLYVKFQSDSSSSGTGFRAEYTTATAGIYGSFIFS